MSRRSAAVTRLLRQWADLKRIESHRFDRSMADHRFAVTLHDLDAARGDADAVRAVADREAAIAIVATRCGAMDVASLIELNVAPQRAASVALSAIDEHAAALTDDAAADVRVAAERLPRHVDSPPSTTISKLADRLSREPRSGATAVGKSRVLVTPTESQSAHSYTAALGGWLIAHLIGGDPAVAFLTGILHHVHNAYLPDSGFAGEVLLGDDLGPVLDTARRLACRHLHAETAGMVFESGHRMSHVDDATARAINAADAADRVLQTHYHQQVADYDAARVCDELDLVHEGPLQSFQNDMLDRLGIHA